MRSNISELNNNICILFHCVCNNEQEVEGPHKELFIKKSELKALFDQLLSWGYVFSLPWNMQKDKPNCVVTFDDGYFNNIRFLELSKEYDVPFILFINSFNILTSKPFIWDIWEDKFKDEYPFGKANSRELYARHGCDAHYSRLDNDWYRPFNLGELKDLSSHKNVHLGLHSHSHQPLIRKQKSEWEGEINNNRQFFIDNNLKYVNDFSLPCGLYTLGSLEWAQKRFERIYTINGGAFSAGDKVINRISLVSPGVSGKSLIQQVDNSVNPAFISMVKNKRNFLRRMKYAYIG